MKNNPLYHFFNQFRGKISSSIYIPFLGKADRNHLALLRNLEKEMEVFIEEENAGFVAKDGPHKK